MADDLDDFFDEIEEAVAEVTEKGEASSDGGDAAVALPSASQTKNNGDSILEGSEKEAEAETRPSKRARVAAASAPARPRGAVVAASAASSSVTVTKKQQLTPPPPPPPPAYSNQSNTVNTNTNRKNNHQNYFGPGLGNGSLPGTIFPPLPPGPMPPLPPGPAPQQQSEAANTTGSSKPVVRMAAGKSWVDSTLSEWPENDFRIFVGNLGAEVDDTMLYDHFKSRYPSVAMSKIVRESKDQHKSKGYGFVSFLQPLDCAKAIREQDQAWLGSRPIRVKRSDWQERNKSTVQKKNRKEKKQQKRRGGGRY